MPIRLEKDKCTVSHPESLRMKRYLSNTRTYFREGIWIREFFSAFFPAIRTDDQGNLFYDFSTLEPTIECQQGANLKDTLLPEALVEQFQQAIDRYQVHINQEGLSFNDEVSSREFTLPDPELHPELYWLLTDEEEVRLVILWGLESESHDANIGLESVADRMRESFLGRASFKPLENPKETTKQKEKITSASSPKRSKGTPPKEASPPSRRGSLSSFVYSGLLVVMLLLAFTFTSVVYLGPEAVVEKQIPDAAHNEGVILSLAAGESLHINSLFKHPSSTTDRVLIFDRFPKPGSYRFEIQTDGETETTPPAPLVYTYSNVRDDMDLNPVASLFLNRNTPEGTITAFVDASFHEDIHKSGELSYLLTWGAENSAFENTPDPNKSFTNSLNSVDGTDSTVTLVVTDKNGHWNRDSIASGPSVSYPNDWLPVPDVQVAGIYSSDAFEEVVLDVSGSYDIDGEPPAILIDWGDGSKTQTFRAGTSFIAHRFKRNNNRISIYLTAQDALGNPSLRPAIVFLDFQSNEMYRAQIDARRLLKTAPSHTLHRSDHNSLGFEVQDRNIVHKRRKLLNLSLRNPANLAFSPLYEVRWTINTPDGSVFEVTDTPKLQLQASEGDYRIVIAAKNMQGERIVCEEHHIVTIEEGIPSFVRLMNWWAKHTPNRELIYHIFVPSAAK